MADEHRPVKAFNSSNFARGGLGFFLLCILMEVFINFLFQNRPQQMALSIVPCLLWGIIGSFSTLIKQLLNKLYVYAMFALYLIGNINTLASYVRYGSHYLSDLQSTNLIYCAFGIFLLIGMLLGERLLPVRKEITSQEFKIERWDTIFLIGCFLFPFIWFADEIYALRRIPILTGESVTEDMYTLNYGILYGYGVLLGVSALLMWSKQVTTVNKFLRLILIGLLTFTAFTMVFDGRRVFLLVFLGALMAFEVARNGDRGFWKRMSLLGVSLVALYMIILYLRQGGMLGTRSSTALTFSQVGVEYRDFAFLVTHYVPGELAGYSWLGSAAGGFANWLILALLGFSKNELVFSGSAYQIALAFRSSFGIRIGLLPEIWLQYGLYGVTFAALMGIFFVWVARLVEESTSEIGRIFACLTYGVAVLSFVGQTSAITGYLSLILYLWLCWRFLELFKPSAPAIQKTG